jgi:sugar transferase (PEP-CTERM/EpsH1 system associated)
MSPLDSLEANPQVAGVHLRTVPRVTKLRVMHVVNHFDTGGTEYGILKVIKGLNGGLFEHQLCTTRGFNEDFVQRKGLEHQVCSVGRIDAGAQFLVPRLVRVMRSYQPHIVHSRNWGTIEAIPAARLARVPVAIHSEHGHELDTLAGYSFRRRVLSRLAYCLADSVCTVSEELREYHARQARMSAKRIRVIPNGVDTVRFMSRPDRRARLRNEFGLPVDAFVIGTVGRMVRIKDHGTLLRAAKALLMNGLDVHVLLAGGGPELADLCAQADHVPELRNRVRFLGESDRVPDVLNAMDVFVLSSISEGMSNTLLEAMATGLPVIATCVGGNPELLGDVGAGWLFEPGDVDTLRGHLTRLIAEPSLREQLGANARRRASEYFALDRMIEQYRHLYTDLAKRRGLLAASEA